MRLVRGADFVRVTVHAHYTRQRLHDHRTAPAQAEGGGYGVGGMVAVRGRCKTIFTILLTS